MRIGRQGDVWTQWYSFDGQQWIAAGSFTFAMTVNSVGIFAGNAGYPVSNFTAVIDYFFNTAQPIIPEDG
jgi:hypothetical protein